MIIFYDEVNLYDLEGDLISSAANPLPAGVQVAFYGGTTVTPATYSGMSGFVTLGGIVAATLQPNQVYTASFSGAQAPKVYGRFTTDSAGNAANTSLLPGVAGAPCSVIGYRSPALSSLGYAIEQTNLWPTGWFSPTAMLPGGYAFPVAAGLGNQLGAMDYIGQALLAAMRLQTSTGAAFALNTQFDGSGSYDSSVGIYDEQYVADAIDSWAADFFGTLWVRQAGMSDAQWVALIQTTLQTPKLTLAGIQQILTAWAPWFSGSVGSGASQALGLDTYGGTDIAIPPPFNASPAFMDTQPGAGGLIGRKILVFDAAVLASPNPISGQPPVLSSSKTLNSYLPTPLVPGEICVYFQNSSNADSGLAPVSNSNQLLNTIVQNWKAAGAGYISGGVAYPCLFAEN
jgi:hypothetical protein